ncbi:MAG: TPM domain-containing protein [Eubacteriales bacterium]|nr:TPM domain-containing protein [Eubacteriales bacterium]
MKRLRVFALFLMLLTMVWALPVNASSSASPKVIDDAGLLSDVELSKLSEELESVSEKSDLDVVVMTVPSIGGSNAQDFADNAYDKGGYSEDGILFLISMEERDYAFSTKGYGMEAFTIAGLGYMEDQFLGSISSGDYYEGFSKYGSLCEDFVKEARKGRPYDTGHLPKKNRSILYLLGSIVLGCVSALSSSSAKRAQHTSVHKQASAANYVTENQITNSRDVFLYRTVNRIKKPEKSSSSGSGAHVSSSGSMHGGKSGKF